MRQGNRGTPRNLRRFGQAWAESQWQWGTQGPRPRARTQFAMENHGRSMQTQFWRVTHRTISKWMGKWDDEVTLNMLPKPFQKDATWGPQQILDLTAIWVNYWYYRTLACYTTIMKRAMSRHASVGLEKCSAKIGSWSAWLRMRGGVMWC